MEPLVVAVVVVVVGGGGGCLFCCLLLHSVTDSIAVAIADHTLAMQ